MLYIAKNINNTPLDRILRNSASIFNEQQLTHTCPSLTNKVAQYAVLHADRKYHHIQKNQNTTKSFTQDLSQYPFSSKSQYLFSSTQITENSTQTPQDQNLQKKIINVTTEKSSMLFLTAQKLSNVIRLNSIHEGLKNRQNEWRIFRQHSAPNQNQLNSFEQLDKNVTIITKCNQYLSKGSFDDYKQYPMVKLVQICLKFIQHHYKTPHTTLYGTQTPFQHWRSLENLIRKRMHNCSIKDYTKVLFIALSSFTSIYKFNHQFIQSLISGIRKEIPLMEQQQLMQLFVVLSQASLDQRTSWEFSLKHSYRSNDVKVKSPFYQHEFLVSLQEEIVEKMVRKYQKKYMNTELFLKEEELFKVCWWLRALIGFKNEKFSQVKAESQSNEMKNRYIVGLVNVISSKLHPDKKKLSTVVISGRLLQNKSIKFKSVGEMVEFMQILTLARDYLSEQGKECLLGQGLDQRSKQAGEKVGIWFDRSQQLNQVIDQVLKYQSVSLMINDLFQIEQKNKLIEDSVHLSALNNSSVEGLDETNLKGQREDNDELKKENRESIMWNVSKWKVLSVINSCVEAKCCSEDLIEWCQKLITDFKVFQLIKSTTQHLIELEGKSLPLQNGDEASLMRLGQIQLRILYLLYNNMYYINKNNSTETQSEQEGYPLQTIDIVQAYQKILESCFFYVSKHNNKETSSLHQLKSIISPETILNLVHLEISLNQLHTTREERKYPGINLIVEYAQQILGLNQSTQTQLSGAQNNSFYVRQLELALYSYLKFYLEDIGEKTQMDRERIQSITSSLRQRNQQAKRYLEQNSLQYQAIINNDKVNPFITQHKYLSLSAHNQSKHSLTHKQKLLQNDHPNHSKESACLGEFIIKIINSERKRYLANEDIIKLTKFFTQIKAFKEIRFCHPLTTFLVCPQFIYIPNPKLMGSRALPKALLFLSPQEIMKPELLSLRSIYISQGLETIVIDRREFLNMHINQRIQRLNELLFSKNSVYQSQSFLKSAQNNIHSIQEKVY